MQTNKQTNQRSLMFFWGDVTNKRRTNLTHKANARLTGSFIPAKGFHVISKPGSRSVLVKFMDLHCSALCSARPKLFTAATPSSQRAGTTRKGVCFPSTAQRDAYFINVFISFRQLGALQLCVIQARQMAN